MNTINPMQESADTTNVLEIEILNHPGALSHIFGLFARRACSIDGIVCVPDGDGSRSRLWLRVANKERIQQMTRFVENLVDVISVRLCGEQIDLFDELPSQFRQPASQVLHGESRL